MERRKLLALTLLGVVAYISCPGLGLRALHRTTGGHKGSTGGLTGQDANGVPLRRSKRGWMWNQFFLLEEYTGTDMQYVGKKMLYWFLMNATIRILHKRKSAASMRKCGVGLVSET